MTTSRYEKPESLKLEWESLGDPSNPHFFERLQQASLETVMTARRVYRDRPERDHIDEVLVTRTQPRIRAVAWRRGRDLTPLCRERIEEELIEGFWNAVLGGESFFEVRFNRALWFLGLSARRKTLAGEAGNAGVMLVSIVQGEWDVDDPGVGVISEEQLAGTAENPGQTDIRLDLQSVLDQLPLEVGRAMVLHYNEDLKIYGLNATERTVASVLMCSERKARGLIAEGLNAMRELLGEDYSE